MRRGRARWSGVRHGRARWNERNAGSERERAWTSMEERRGGCEVTARGGRVWSGTHRTRRGEYFVFRPSSSWSKISKGVRDGYMSGMEEGKIIRYVGEKELFNWSRDRVVPVDYRVSCDA